MNVYIKDRNTQQPVARYEIHLAVADETPPEEKYFDAAWRKALQDGVVTPDRDTYEFQLQPPKNLYESSR
jgi:hypothetical protein